MKKLLTTILTVCLLMAATSTAMAAENIKIRLNGQPLAFEQAPYTAEGSTMVPMRVIFEALGAGVDYDGATQKITATKGETTIELTLGQKTAVKNGQSLTLDAAAVTRNGNTMVPLRFVAEALQAQVDWDGATQTVSINLSGANTNSGSPENTTTPDNSSQTSPQSAAFEGKDLKFVSLGEKAPYKTITKDEVTELTETVYFDNYRIENSWLEQSQEGYEYRIVEVRYEYTNEASLAIGSKFAAWPADYYKGLNFDDKINYNGQECEVEISGYFVSDEFDEATNKETALVQFVCKVPVGYDGIVIIAYNAKIHEALEAGEMTIDELKDYEPVCFRLK